VSVLCLDINLDSYITGTTSAPLEHRKQLERLWPPERLRDWNEGWLAVELWDTLCQQPATMGDEDDQKRGIVLSKECGVQSSRFGEGSRDFIKRMVLEPNSGLPVQADGEEEEDEEQQEEEQEDVDFNEDYDLVLVPGFGRITSRDARILNAPARHSDNDGRARETPPTARIPVVARSRLNLTALSKDYNVSSCGLMHQSTWKAD
jgi:hypothetical protein